MRLRLQRARLRPQAIDEALATVAEQGYLDDARYARRLVEDRRAIDGWGVGRIRARLEAAGIDGELIDELLAGFDHASEVAAAEAVVRRRCKLPLTGDRERQRAFGLLVQRGFDSEVAYEAVCGASSARLRRACGGSSPGFEWGDG
jgi:regulatory protein